MSQGEIKPTYLPRNIPVCAGQIFHWTWRRLVCDGKWTHFL